MVANLAAVSVLALASVAAAKSSSSSSSSSHSSSSHKASKSSSHAASATITKAAVAASKVANAAASSSPLPLTDYKYDYADIPYQVNPYAVGRGPQSGYNICNSTTAGDDSLCQTLIMNSISDFCLWGSPTSNSEIGDVEAEVVAFCSESNPHGSRTFPDGTITGVQWIRTSAYIQITGFLDQTKLGLTSDDSGGELDPHGADELGNPLGGLVYTNSMYEDSNSTDASAYTQAYNWNNFIGSNTFCFKLCYNNVTSPDYCQNKFDLIGCNYNMPSSNTEGEFLKCDGDLQDEVGTYTGDDGKTTVWSQPASIAADYTMPYTPRTPASSNCITYSSEELFGSAAASTSAAASSATASATDASATSSVASGTASATAQTGSIATATASSTASATDSASASDSASATDSSSASMSTATGTASAASAAAATSASSTSDAMRVVVGSSLAGAAVLGALALLF